MSNNDLSKIILGDTNLINTTLKIVTIYRIAVWDVQLDGAEQINLAITPEDEPTIALDNLKVAQFLYLLLNSQELHDVHDFVIERGIQLLGRRGGSGLEELKTIATKAREHKYFPIIFDFDRLINCDLSEIVMTIADLSGL